MDGIDLHGIILGIYMVLYGIILGIYMVLYGII